MSNPKGSVDGSDEATVSNNSPQSPTGKTLLEPITLDFDPMSFKFKEDSPLTSPDSNHDINEMLGPSQHADVEFFDPFCPVKEESPTDYYPNVMLGQTPVGYSSTDNVSEQPQYPIVNEPSVDDLSEEQHYPSTGEPLLDGFTHSQQFSNLDKPLIEGFSISQELDDPLIKAFSELQPSPTSDGPFVDDFADPRHYSFSDQPLVDNLAESQLSNLEKPLDFAQDDAQQLSPLENPLNFVSDEIEQLSPLEKPLDYVSEEITLSQLERPLDYTTDDLQQLSPLGTPSVYISEDSHFSENFSENVQEDIAIEQCDNLINVNDVVDHASVEDELEHVTDETSTEFPPEVSTNSVTMTMPTSNKDELSPELESPSIEEADTLSFSKPVCDDNKHDSSLQHEQCQISEADVPKKGRSILPNYSSRSNRSEKYKSTESKYKEESKSKKYTEKESYTKKETSISSETNGYSSHNGIDSTISKMNTKNAEISGKMKEEQAYDSLASVTDLKSSLMSNADDSQSNTFQEDVKPSVDRAKVQRTFSQNMQDELCLCKICSKHVYQMEKMKAEKSVFHKNCFRCKECNKLLNVDSYSSNEGDIYCKPHFRQLFQPKAKFDGEDPAPKQISCDEGKQRRNEMIIRENIPAELPPDVVRADSKPDHGLDDIPANLSSIKSKFEIYREEHHLPSTTDVCTLQRSASVMARLAKYQSAVSGGDNENGELSDSDNDEMNEDQSVIKHSKHKEKVVFSGMSSLKSQWETGSVAATKEEKIEEKKEELNKLRQRICLGRSESMKAVYEKACQDTSNPVAPRCEPVNVGRETKANRLKEKFEKGELVNEVEEENLEKFRREKEEDLSVFTEPGIANDAKKLFKEIDATAKATVTTPKSPSKSPLRERQIGLHSPVKDADVIKCSEPTEKEEIMIDTTDVTQRFKFFENYSEGPKERKRFQITPPREPVKENSPEPEISVDPNVIRSVDAVDDIPATDTTRRMLDKFKALEKETPTVPSGPKPLKRITPPREYTKVNDDHDMSPEPERDPNIIRSSYKADDDIIVEADKAKSLKAKFENWDIELKDNKKNEDEEEDFLPQIDTTKTLRAKFEAIKEDTLKTVEKPKPKVHRFIQEQAAVSMDICNICGKKAYPMEKMETSGMCIHKNCFRCAHCSCMLRLENYTKSGNNLYCTPHFKQLFISRGNYDEGFGREQHKEKWNRSCNNTPVPHTQDLQENDDMELSNGDVQCLKQTV